jgi:hypothetical protein
MTRISREYSATFDELLFFEVLCRHVFSPESPTRRYNVGCCGAQEKDLRCFKFCPPPLSSGLVHTAVYDTQPACYRVASSDQLIFESFRVYRLSPRLACFDPGIPC